MRIRGIRNNCFSENVRCFVFLKHPFWDLPFLPYYRRYSLQISQDFNLSMQATFRFARNSAETVPQNYFTKKLGEITVFYVMLVMKMLNMSYKQQHHSYKNRDTLETLGRLNTDDCEEWFYFFRWPVRNWIKVFKWLSVKVIFCLKTIVMSLFSPMSIYSEDLKKFNQKWI